MKYAFNTWAYGSFPTWLPAYPIEMVVDRLAGIGYDAIEIGCAAPHAWPDFLSGSQRTALRRYIERSGLAVSSVLPAPGGGPGGNVSSFVPEERAWAVNHYKSVIDLGADLGAGVALYVAGWRAFGTSQSEAWKWSQEALAEIGAHAASRGLKVAIEPTSADSNVIETAGDALELMTSVGLDNVGVMFDTFHILYRNEVMSDYAREMGSSLVHTHWSDFGRLAPGDGGADFSPLAAALKEIDYQGYICMEIGFNGRDVDPDVVASHALKNVKDLFGD
jgi:fructoselysine 3-epimerase